MDTQWYDLLRDSADPNRTGGSGKLLWLGAKRAIAERPAGRDGMLIYRDVLAALGKDRKSAASKIKTVALAVEKGLDVDNYKSLHAAYTAAVGMLR